MGSLKSGAAYIYERNDNTIYAREAGSSERFVVGYYPTTGSGYKEIDQVLKMCDTDPAMKQLLNQLIVLYNLKKNRE